jgi:hypothetical protein
MTVSQEKWDKSKQYLEDMVEELSQSNILTTRSWKGSSHIYMSQTYLAIVLYLKGTRQTLEHWRPNRDTAGLKGKATREKDPEIAVPHEAGPPKFVEVAPRLAGDLEALQLLTTFACSPQGGHSAWPQPWRCTKDREMLLQWGLS